MGRTVAMSWKARRPALKSPHFWITVAVSMVVLLIYQAWPFREWRFTSGFWSHFPWLSSLQYLVTKVEVPYQLNGSLFLIPIIYGSLAASWPGGVVAWLIGLVWVLPALIGWSTKTMAINIALLLLPVLLVALVTVERRWRETEKRNYAEREHERRSYIAGLVETQEAERHRIAQEIHDDTLQTLMAIANKSESLTSSEDLATSRQGCEWIKHEILKTTDDLRRLSMNLRPSILDHFGLVSGIEWLVNASNLQNGCQFEMGVEGDEHELPELKEVTVFRVIQEAINNTLHHARASRGRVALAFDRDHLSLSVSDDGAGFTRPERFSSYATQGRLGIIGMEQRVLSVGGTVRVESGPGQGTTVSAIIPY